MSSSSKPRSKASSGTTRRSSPGRRPRHSTRCLRLSHRSTAGCLFYEQATFVTNFFTQDFPDLNLKAGTDYDYFGHPSMGNSQFDNNVNFFYDNVAVYNNTPAVRKLMQYLSTAQAQQIWANDGGTLGAIKSL